jgi:hypothetical protein
MLRVEEYATSAVEKNVSLTSRRVLVGRAWVKVQSVLDRANDDNTRPREIGVGDIVTRSKSVIFKAGILQPEEGGYTRKWNYVRNEGSIRSFMAEIVPVNTLAAYLDGVQSSFSAAQKSTRMKRNFLSWLH